MDETVAPAEAKPGDIILQRDCWIEAPDGEVSPLTLRFTRPAKHEFGMVGHLLMECKHFARTERVYGGDDLEVLTRLLWIGRIGLENRSRDGYTIWWRAKGDLDFYDFWGGSQFQQEFSLPSAVAGARREAFYAANEGKHLMPSHRIGVEPDRPAITIYKVNADGSDRLGCVIGPEQLKGQTWESVAQLVSDSTLWDSREGIELMIALQPDRKAEA